MSLFNTSPHFEAQKVASLPITQPHFQSFMDSKPISKSFNCTNSITHYKILCIFVNSSFT